MKQTLVAITEDTIKLETLFKYLLQSKENSSHELVLVDRYSLKYILTIKLK